MGTQLMARGMRAGQDCPESWNLDRPAVVRAIYEAYFLAGANAVQTNTFGANRLRLQAFQRHDVRALNLAGAHLAREVRPTGGLVIGCIGPTGAIPPPEGKADLAEMEDSFAEQAAFLVEGGVDLLHIETMYHPKEARAALRGARGTAPGVAIVGSMTCRRTTSGYTTPLGFTTDAMLAAFLEEGADGIGVNCTLAPADMLDLVRFLRARTDLPIFAKPTIAPSGEAPLLPEDLALGAVALFTVGASAVGGCCGAGPPDIAAVRRTLDADFSPARPHEIVLPALSSKI